MEEANELLVKVLQGSEEVSRIMAKLCVSEMTQKSGQLYACILEDNMHASIWLEKLPAWTTRKLVGYNEWNGRCGSPCCTKPFVSGDFAAFFDPVPEGIAIPPSIVHIAKAGKSPVFKAWKTMI